MKKTLAIVSILVLGLAVILYWQARQPAPSLPDRTVKTPPQPVPETRPEYPVRVPAAPPEEEPASVPDSADPDAADQDTGSMPEILARLFDGEGFERYFIPENFIQRFVIMVDNLPRRQLPSAHLPTRPVPGEFKAGSGEDGLIIDPENYERYRPFLRLVEGVDPEKAVALYAKLYPRFQKAYEQLGYPNGYFNDRLVSVIDHLLATPRIEGPVRLQRPEVRYVYADSRLEEMSAGRKVLIRSGSENTARIKRLLEIYRRELVGLAEG